MVEKQYRSSVDELTSPWLERSFTVANQSCSSSTSTVKHPLGEPCRDGSRRGAREKLQEVVGTAAQRQRLALEDGWHTLNCCSERCGGG